MRAAVAVVASPDPVTPSGFLYAMSVQATAQAARWLELARDLAEGVPWSVVRTRAEIVLAEGRLGLQRGAYQVPTAGALDR